MKTVKALIDEQLIFNKTKNLHEKYKAKVAYLKIDENILNNLSNSAKLTKKKQKICLTILEAQQTQNQPLQEKLNFF